MTLADTYSQSSPNWYTPPRWRDWVDRTIGHTWFDPCPEEWESRNLVSGLDCAWGARTYCNHPGAKRGAARVWWAKALHELERDNVEKLVWCAFNIEQLRHLRDNGPLEQPGFLVLPDKRVGFAWGGEDLFKCPCGHVMTRGEVEAVDCDDCYIGGCTEGDDAEGYCNTGIDEGDLWRNRGAIAKSPGNWAAWWTNVEPAAPPEACRVMRTGGDIYRPEIFSASAAAHGG